MKKVTLRLRDYSIAKRIALSRSILLQMAGNPTFLAPNPTLAAVTVATDEAETAMNKAVNGTKADTVDMYAKMKTLEQLLTGLAGYVEYIANLSGNPNTAIDIITSAGMGYKRTGSINIPILSAKLIGEGEITLRRKFEKGKGTPAYLWQQSANNTDWETIGESTVTKFTVTGLEPLTRYYFRSAIVRGQLQEPWTDSITFVVAE